MSDSLYPYYERELLFIRQMAQGFAKQYPAAAGRLLLEPNRSVDPHVERLIESFALLTARVQHKLDDEFPELTESLLGVLYPHYLAPIPSMSIIQFVLDATVAPVTEGFVIDKHSRLHTQPVNDLPVKFRTCYPVTLWPVEVTAAKFQTPPYPAGLQAPPKTAAIVRLQLECQGGVKFNKLTLDKLRFHLTGDPDVTANLYEYIFNRTTQVAIRPLDGDTKQPPIVLAPEQCLSQVGFERDEGMLPYPNHSFLGYRLLTEFFAFPSKFFFFDLSGLQRACQAGFQNKLEIVFFLNRTLSVLEQGVEAQTFRLGCTPVINLFEQVAEPISLTHARTEYLITPDVTNPTGMEIYSVNSVTSTEPTTGANTEYQPFYSFSHGNNRDTQQCFWYASRRASTRAGDRGTEVDLTLVDLGFNPRLPTDSTLVVRTTCTNRDLPFQLQRMGDQLYIELEAAAPLAAIRCLRAPTVPLRPPLRRGAHWRLISHLLLNHLSIADATTGREALREILRLYDFSDPETGQQLAAVVGNLIDGILTVSSRRVVGRTGTSAAHGFCRGVEVNIEFDEQKYFGTGAFLFASVLERFLGLYASINSFTQLVAKTKQGEGYFKRWPPRAGELQLL
jgi:type VI secretion system protein ImpG